MKENTNSAILINSVILYVRLAVTSIAGLLTTRYLFQALGAYDFGIFSVVAGVISFIAIINTIMISTSNRFIATAIGKNDNILINETFNVNLIIHVVIALFTLCLSYPIGNWYILNHVNYIGDISSVVYVYNVTVVGAIIAFIGVPYNGLLLAKERFFVFSFVDILSSLAKLAISYILIDNIENKLSFYAVAISVLSAVPTFVFILYCKKVFPKIVSFKFVNKVLPYKEVLGFSFWTAFGAVASIGKTQGAALLVNYFFSTLMNTALGIANSVNFIVLTFAHNVARSISPQIVKSYASGDMNRCENLVLLSSKYSFMVMLLASSPFLIIPDYIFSLWLGDIPEYVIIFTFLLIVDALISVLNSGIPELIFATGKIKWYQFIVNSIYLSSVVVAFFVLSRGFPAYYLQITYIVFSLIVFIVRQIVLNKIIKFNNWKLIKKSYFPCFVIILLYIPVVFLKSYFDEIVLFLFSSVYLLILYYFLGISRKEKDFFRKKLSNIYTIRNF